MYNETEEPQDIEVEAFGHRFRTLPGLAEDLITLEREGAVYAHFWDEDSQVFKYYKISLLPKEVVEYVESHVEKQRFDDALDAGARFDEALQSIVSLEIRKRVVSYGDEGRTELRDGTVADLRGCAASCYTEELEALLCGQLLDRYEPLPNIGDVDKRSLIISMLDNFRVVACELGNRRHSRPPFTIENEYDAQDLLYACIRSAFNDARREEGTPHHAGSAKRIDIVVPSAETVVEVKCVRDRAHSKKLADEIKIDIESYHTHGSCRLLLFLVYDPSCCIADPEPLQNDLSGRRMKDDVSFKVQVLVRR